MCVFMYGMVWIGMVWYGTIDMRKPCKIRGREVCLGAQPIRGGRVCLPEGDNINQIKWWFLISTLILVGKMLVQSVPLTHESKAGNQFSSQRDEKQ